MRVFGGRVCNDVDLGGSCAPSVDHPLIEDVFGHGSAHVKALSDVDALRLEGS
jgi:hypothetical protein